MTDKEFVCRIHKQSLQLSNKTNNSTTAMKGRRFKNTLHKRGYMNGSEAHEKTPNIISHWENANINHKEIPFPTH